VGDEKAAPTADEILAVLTSSDGSIVVNLIGSPLERRPLLLTPLLARLGEVRARTGRPHWVVLDEAHHMMPEGEVSLPDTSTNLSEGVLLITVHPERLPRRVLTAIDTVLVVGKTPRATLHAFAGAAGAPAPDVDEGPLPSGTCLIWRPKQAPQSVTALRVVPPRAERHRHQRKYATGELGEDKSFYFRGPKDALNLRAHNLALFVQMGDGVDDETWLFHLAEGHYSDWFRRVIKNQDLANEVLVIERDARLGAIESRKLVRRAIERVYTLPA
jgi:hypothetical protein